MAVLQQVKGEAGVFVVPQLGKKIKLVEWREDYKFDTIEVVAGAPASGATYYFFRDIQSKDLIDTNFSTARRIDAGEEMIINRMGVATLGNRVTGVTIITVDQRWSIERLYLDFQINKKTVAQGPVMCFPSGLGLTGFTNDSTTTIASNGVASTAAVPRLLVPQEITNDHDLSGILTHYGCGWTTATYAPPTIAAGGMFIRFLLNGYVKSALGK